MRIATQTLKKIYYHLVKIRKFEEKIVERYPRQEIRCPVHLSIGQEAIAVGVCAHLKKEDYLFSNHRNHGHLIAKGADIRPMFAELYGRKAGCARGKGGSMHMVAEEVNIMGTSAIVAGGIPIALGCAFASQLKRQKTVTAVFFGDGAVDEGTFFESLNFASLKKLPIVFICENNFYATNSPQRSRQVNTDIYAAAKHFKMPGHLVDGNDVFSVLRAAGKAVERARNRKGPSLIEARTYRWKTHVGPETDIDKGFRSKEEVWPWKRRCPIKRFESTVRRKRLLSLRQLDVIETSVEREVDQALGFALRSPYPTRSDLYKDVY